MPKPTVIDLSHYQVIPQNLKQAREAGIVGVIHKFTEGLTYKDPKADNRMFLAKDAGMLWGGYHFLKPGNIKHQADWFLAQSALIDEDTLLCLDFEVTGVTLDEVLFFLDYVKEKSGQEPVLYSGSYLKDAIRKEVHAPEGLSNYRLWIPQYSSKVVLPQGWKEYWLWQYSDKGTIPGIDGHVDVNNYSGTERELLNDWVRRVSTAAPADNPPIGTDSGTIADSNGVADPTTTKQPSTTTDDKQTIIKERPGLFAKVMTAIFTAVATAIASITTTCGGSEVWNQVSSKGTERVIENTNRSDLAMFGLVLAYILVGLGAATFLFWIAAKFWDRNHTNATTLNVAKVKAAEDKNRNTVEFKK